MSIGFPELILILAILALLFGGKKIPEVAEAMGKAIRNFKKASHESDKELPEKTDSSDDSAASKNNQ